MQVKVEMSKEKRSGREAIPPLDEYSEYDEPQKRREIRSLYRDLMNETKGKIQARPKIVKKPH